MAATSKTKTARVKGNVAGQPVRRNSNSGPFATFPLVRNADCKTTFFNVITEDYSDRILSLQPGAKVLIEGTLTVLDGRYTLRSETLTIISRPDGTTCLY